MGERGLVRRGRGAGQDGRAALVTITDQGRTAYRRALGPHLASAKRWFLDGIAPEALDTFDTTLAALLEHLRRAGEEDPS
jgi:DNA-binding MarR family transcriptional regulator